MKINVDILFSLDVHCALKNYSSLISWQVPIGEECVPLQNLCKFNYAYDGRYLKVRKFNTNSKWPTHWPKTFSRNNKNFAVRVPDLQPGQSKIYAGSRSQSRVWLGPYTVETAWYVGLRYTHKLRNFRIYLLTDWYLAQLGSNRVTYQVVL